MYNKLTKKEILIRISDAPWLIKTNLLRILTRPIVNFYFKISGVSYGKHSKIFGIPNIQRYRGSIIKLGDYVELRSSKSSNPLIPNHPISLSTRSHKACIKIGNHCGLTGTVIIAEQSITIGNYVVIGANCTIVDTDFHPLDAEKRRVKSIEAEHKSVIIEDDVFIGMNSIILKGVKIGKRSIIGAGSVVTKDVPSDTIAAGNPARIVKSHF